MITIAELNRLADWWADELGLKDWTFHVELTSGLGTEIRGRCEALEFHKRALIQLEIQPEPEVIPYEKVLVHEILHVWVWQFMEDENLPKAQVKDLEQALNGLAEALIELRQAAGLGPGTPQGTSQEQDE